MVLPPRYHWVSSVVRGPLSSAFCTLSQHSKKPSLPGVSLKREAAAWGAPESQGGGVSNLPTLESCASGARTSSGLSLDV